MGEDITLLLILQARDLASAVLAGLKTNVGQLAKSFEQLSGMQKAAVAGLALGGVASLDIAKRIGGFMKEGVHQAIQFQAAINTYHTQARASMSETKKAGDEVLTTANKLGLMPLALANMGYVFESLGARTRGHTKLFKQDLQELISTAGKLQQVATAGGQMQLDPTQTARALSSLLVNPVQVNQGPGKFRSSSAAAGALLKVAGLGEMTLPELIRSLQTGLPNIMAASGVGAAQGFGALETMTDAMIPPSRAAIYERQIIQMLQTAATKPKTEGMLESIGLSGGKLQELMRGPTGLVGVFQALQTHLEDSTPKAVKFAQALIGEVGQTKDHKPLLDQTKAQIDASLAYIKSAIPEMSKQGKALLSAQLGVADRSNSIQSAIDRLRAQAGNSKNFASEVFSILFGGARTGAGAATLLEDLPRFRERVRQNMAQGGLGAQSIDPAYRSTMGTAAGQISQFHSSVTTLRTAIGQGLLPLLGAVLEGVNKILKPLANWASHHKVLAAVIAGSLVAFFALAGVLMLVAAAAILLDGALLPIIAIAAAVVAAIAAIGVIVYEVLKHWNTWGKYVAMVLAVLMPFIGVPLLIYKYWGQIAPFFEHLWGRVERLAREAWPRIVDFMTLAWNRAVLMGETVWRDFEGWLGTLWGDITGTAISAWSNISGFLGDIWNNIKNGAIDGLQSVVSWFENLPSTLLGLLGDALNWLLGVGKDAITGLWNGMKYVWDNAPGWLLSLGSSILSLIGSAARWLYGVGKDAVQGLWDGMKFIWDNAPAWISNLGSSIGNMVGAAAKWLWQKGSDAIGGLWSGMKAAWGDVSAWLGNVDQRAISAIGSAIKWLYNTGQDALNGLWNGMKAIFKDVSGWLDGIAGKIKSLKGPPSKDATILIDNGRLVMQGFSLGLMQGWAGVQRQLGAYTSQLGSFGGGIPVAQGAGGGGATFIVDLSGSSFIDDASINRMLDRVGGQLAQRLLPGSGMVVRRR